MKRLLMTMGIAALSSMAFSQSVYDALTFSQFNPVLGTARYAGMAGAFTALGGNSSAIKDNPGALGIYRSSELTFSPSLYINNDGEVKGALDNFAFVINFGNKKRKHGYVTSSLGINYNRSNISRYTRQKMEESSVSLSDYFGNMGPGDPHYYLSQDINLLDEEGYSLFAPDAFIQRGYTLMEKGHIGQWDIAYGLNISNIFYVGAAFGINTIEYKQSTIYDEETLPNYEYDHWYMDKTYYASGHGFNFRVGAIVRPIDELRIGASFETPTYYDMSDYYDIEIGDDFASSLEPQDEAFYDIRTPLKFKAGLAGVIGKKAMIDVDYQYQNYKKIRMKADDINIDSETDIAEERMNQEHTIKVGAEVQVADGFFVRAGGAYSTSPTKDLTAKEAASVTNLRICTVPKQAIYVTGGAGYKGEHFYCDLAYAFQNRKDHLYPFFPYYSEPKEANLKTRNIIATIGWRF